MKDSIIMKITENSALLRILTSVSGITIIEYDAVNIDGSRAVLEVLGRYAHCENLTVTVVLLGEDDEIVRNKKVLESYRVDIKVLPTGNNWDKQNFEELNISDILILHMLFPIGIDNKESSFERYFNVRKYKNRKLVKSIVNQTRKIYYASFLKSETNDLFDSPVGIDCKITLDDLRFTPLASDNGAPSLFCSDKKDYMTQAIENLSPKDAFFLCFDEMESGCTECNQCDRYGKRRHCPIAQCNIARFYSTGEFVDRNDRIAYQWWLKASRQGYLPARIAVVESLMKGVGCKKNISAALRLYIPLACKSEYKYLAPMVIDALENNDGISGTTAVRFIAMLANDGDEKYIKKLVDAFDTGAFNLPMDPVQKRYWERLLTPVSSGSESGSLSAGRIESLIEKASSGDREAQIKLCNLYFDGESIPADYGQSAYWGEKALAQGDRSCRFMVAYSSAETGCHSRAMELYSELADEGNTTAMNNLGCLEQETAKKVFWFGKAADSGNTAAQYNVSFFYKSGRGVEQSYAQALSYLKKSADNGYKPAFTEMARYYRYGYGVDPDPAEMLKWYDKAVSAGDINAIQDLAFLYRYGNCVTKDCKKAMEYYYKLIQTGNDGAFDKDSLQVAAMYSIGRMYEFGEGVTANRDKAVFWFRKAALYDHYESKAALIRLKTNWIDKNGNTVSE